MNINFESINNINHRLEEIKTIQPNVYKLWKVFLKKKERDYSDSLNQCANMLNNISEYDKKVTISDLQTLIILRKLC
jgi:hypothetical protein